MIKNEDEKAGNEAAEVRRTQLIKPAHMVVMEGVAYYTTASRGFYARTAHDAVSMIIA